MREGHRGTRALRTAHTAGAAVNGSGRGGWYEVTSYGKKVRLKIYVSREYPTWDRAINRSWAQAFANMPHGTEISKLTVYIAPFSEIASDAVCGSAADSCYYPDDATMYLSGETPPDQADMTQIAMHEYGHHVANFRSNVPWDSVNWGPKRWASTQGVCALTRERVMWPTDPTNHYEDHPGEIWAETYRIVASKAMNILPDPWEILSARWNPLSRNDLLNAAGRDVSLPWQGPRKTSATGKLLATGAQSAIYRLPVTLDGEVAASLKTSGGLKATVRLTTPSGDQLTAKSTSSVNWTACGVQSVSVVVNRTGGKGTWTLTIQHPGT